MSPLFIDDLSSFWNSLYSHVYDKFVQYDGDCFQLLLEDYKSKQICSMVGLISEEDIDKPCPYTVLIREHATASLNLLVVNRNCALPPIVKIPFTNTSYKHILQDYRHGCVPEYWFVKDQKPMSDRPLWYAIDTALAPIMTRLWNLGFTTHWSCAGHPFGTYINLTPPPSGPLLLSGNLSEIGWKRLSLSEEHRKLNNTPNAESWRIPRPQDGYSEDFTYVIRNKRIRRLCDTLDTMNPTGFTLESLITPERIVLKDGKYYGDIPTMKDFFQKS